MQMQETVKELSPTARYEYLNKVLRGAPVSVFSVGGDHMQVIKYNDYLAGHIEVRHGNHSFLVAPDGFVVRSLLLTGVGSSVPLPIEKGTGIVDSLIARLAAAK